MKRIILLGFLIGISIAITACTATVADNQLGVYIDRNGDAHQLEPGEHFLGWEPVSVYLVSTDVQTYTMATAPGSNEVSADDSLEARSADGVGLKIDAEVVFRIGPDNVTQLVTTFGSDQSRYIPYLIRPWTRTTIYNTTLKYNYKDTIGDKRGEAEAAMSKQLAEQLQPFGITLLKLTLLEVANE